MPVPNPDTASDAELEAWRYASSMEALAELARLWELHKDDDEALARRAGFHVVLPAVPVHGGLADVVAFVRGDGEADPQRLFGDRHRTVSLKT